jgi:hypothetical protein
MGGVTIRPGRVEDALDIAIVHSTSWRATYRGIVPQPYLDGMEPEKTVERWQSVIDGKVTSGPEILVAEDSAKIVGFQVYGPAREPSFGFSGELYAAYFLPEFMGKGLGTAMVKIASRNLGAQNINDMIVWVLEANTRGRRFYETVLSGIVVPNSRKTFEIEGTSLWEIAYGFRPLPLLK